MKEFKQILLKIYPKNDTENTFTIESELFRMHSITINFVLQCFFFNLGANIKTRASNFPG